MARASTDAGPSKASDATSERDFFKLVPSANFSVWYNRILDEAELVDRRYGVKGIPVLRSAGFYMHNAVMRKLETYWEEIGIEGVLFPTLIPYKFLAREADHIRGFKDECFWIQREPGVPESEGLALRPTSEAAMYSMFALWIQSYNQLPIRIHQTCSVFRVETKDTHPLIRVREIPWNEAHCAFETREGCLANLEDAWRQYLRLIEGRLGVFGLRLRRPDWDKFAGAEHTDVLDCVMPSGKVLQCVGAHYLGTKFAVAYDITFEDRHQKPGQHPHINCYGVSTRLIAAVIGQHGDEYGLRLPPLVAQVQVAIVPIPPRGKQATTTTLDALEREAEALAEALRTSCERLRVAVDTSGLRPASKYYHWELRGVPLRIELGAREVKENKLCVVPRDLAHDEARPRKDRKLMVDWVRDDADATARLLRAQLDAYFTRLAGQAKARAEAAVSAATTADAVVEVIRTKGGFVRVPVKDMEAAHILEEQINPQCHAELRGWKPGESAPPDTARCIVTGEPAQRWVYIAKAY